jgi:hypothetical protein
MRKLRSVVLTDRDDYQECRLWFMVEDREITNKRARIC